MTVSLVLRVSTCFALGVLGLFFTFAALAGSSSVTFQYDNAGRLRSATYNDASKSKYTLDAVGNRTILESGPAGTVALNTGEPMNDPTVSSPALLVAEFQESTSIGFIADKVTNGSAEQSSWPSVARVNQEMSEARTFRPESVSDTSLPVIAASITAERSPKVTKLPSDPRRLRVSRTKGAVKSGERNVREKIPVAENNNAIKAGSLALLSRP